MPETKKIVNPNIAIIDGNTLSLLGLRQILQLVMPVMKVDTFISFAELADNDPDQYAHYFVAAEIVVANRPFFDERKRKTIVLSSSSGNELTADFHCLRIDQPEQKLIHSILALQQHAHSHGRNLPHDVQTEVTPVLSKREVEVLSLIVQGHINKEVADRLHISLSTVITHRKNITDKLGIKSLSALTIYAVTHGYVDITSLHN